jgi:hypothetical protein
MKSLSDKYNFASNFPNFASNFQSYFFVPILFPIDFWTQKNNFCIKIFRFWKNFFPTLERVPPCQSRKFFFPKSKIFYAKDVLLGSEIDWEQKK